MLNFTQPAMDVATSATVKVQANWLSTTTIALVKSGGYYVPAAIITYWEGSVKTIRYCYAR
jgi:hypothetical protein